MLYNAFIPIFCSSQEKLFSENVIETILINEDGKNETNDCNEGSDDE